MIDLPKNSEAATVADWERFQPVQEGSADWNAYRSFKGPMFDSLGRRMRGFALAQLVGQAAKSKVPGDYAECGCFMGHSTHIIAQTMTDNGVNMPLFVFDSFAGLSPATPEDFVTGENLDKKGMQARLRTGESMFASPLQQTAANLVQHQFIKFVPGWIPETLPVVAGRSFAFVHIDLDVYAPIKAALAFFYERLSPGGIIFVDDYNFTDWPGAKIATDEVLAGQPPSFFFELPLGGAFLIK